jgi:hypothetical protein
MNLEQILRLAAKDKIVKAMRFAVLGIPDVKTWEMMVQEWINQFNLDDIRQAIQDYGPVED